MAAGPSAIRWCWTQVGRQMFCFCPSQVYWAIPFKHHTACGRIMRMVYCFKRKELCIGLFYLKIFCPLWKNFENGRLFQGECFKFSLPLDLKYLLCFWKIMKPHFTTTVVVTSHDNNACSVFASKVCLYATSFYIASCLHN